MVTVRGFDLPEELYYLVEKHLWARPLPTGSIRLGLTPVAYHLLGGTLVAISVRPGIVGGHVVKGKSVAMVESLKYIGPVPAPCAGIVLLANDSLGAHPQIAAHDPYGEGWIAEIEPDNWTYCSRGLVTGLAAIDAYRALLESQNIQ